MIGYLIRRFMYLAVVLLFSMAVFHALYLVGANIAIRSCYDTCLRDCAPPSEIHRQQSLLGMEKPWYLWYPVWLAGDDWLGKIGFDEYVGERKGILRGDWGRSARYQRNKPVIDLIANRLPATLSLVAGSILIALALGSLAGAFSRGGRPSIFERSFAATHGAGMSLSLLWLGLPLIALSLHAKSRGWFYFPVDNRIHGASVPGLGAVPPRSLLDYALRLALPATVLALFDLATWSHLRRAGMFAAPGVSEAGRAHGPEGAFAEAGRLGPLLPAIPASFGAAVIVEIMFGRQGLGSMFVAAVNQKDYPLVLAFLPLVAAPLALATLLSDALRAIGDPRLRRKPAQEAD